MAKTGFLNVSNCVCSCVCLPVSSSVTHGFQEGASRDPRLDYGDEDIEQMLRGRRGDQKVTFMLKTPKKKKKKGRGQDGTKKRKKKVFLEEICFCS